MVRLSLLVLLTGVLCFASGCGKTEEPPAPPAPDNPEMSQDQGTPEMDEPNDTMMTPAEPMATPDEQTEPMAEDTPGPEMAPVDIELPKPMFVGTPTDTRVENLKKPLGKPRPPFLAPVGTKLLSLNKPVTSSDDLPIIGDIPMVTDGDKEAADGSYVELGPMLQYVTIDLEQECEINAIVLWHYHKQPRVYFDVVVQISDDPDFVENVTTVFNNDIDNSAGLGVGEDMHYVETAEGELIDCFSQGSPKGRYVRCYSRGNNSNDLNHYIEVDVYGKPVQ
jgi:hypothetical protein